ncbi:MAG: oligosaccharide flippase family protein [Rhodococcus sp.]|nr:oligosaccharide flippase family protein [Rhodococcus sp. (in: high G+C Gram-positive bacteria)]MBJ7323342.1 oligosaccharide flippase family protein [Rhodococcus sp. (in: high G+C Gram-positive bacteria)]
MSGLTWTYSSQMFSVVIQFGYAAITSRMVTSGGFGTYAVALTVAGFISLIANGGLGQSVSRMVTVEDKAIGGLASFSILLGLAGSGLLYLSAGFWSDIWGDEGARFVIELLCISLVVSPHIGLNLGLMRREGKFRKLAISTFVSNSIGMSVGLVLVVTLQSAASLVASPIVSQLVLLMLCSIHNRGRLLRFRSVASARSDIGFSANVIVSSVLSYFASNLGKWSVSRWIGAPALGQWNRADVVTTVPFFQLQTAIVQVVYPEFRHDREGSERSHTVWPDLLTLVAWLCVPIACFAIPIMPIVVPVLFGEGWVAAAALAGPLVLIAAIQVVTTVLGGAVEALGKFRWIWSAQVLMILVQSVGVVFTIMTRSLVPAVVSMGVVVVGRQAVYLVLCHRAKLFNAMFLVKNYSLVAAASLTTGIVGYLVSISVESPSIWWVTAALALALTGSAYRWRSMLPPVVIFGRYKKLRSNSELP